MPLSKQKKFEAQRDRVEKCGERILTQGYLLIGS